jgi:hypothetical protein
MLDDKFLSRGEVVGERRDDLPCYVCGEYGDIIIIKVADRTYDLCPKCARNLGILR